MRIFVLMTLLLVGGCAPTKTLAPEDKAQIRDLDVTIAMRFEELTINCRGLGCAGILYGVGGDPNGPAALTSAYRRAGPRGADLVADEIRVQLKARGINVRTTGETRFITVPQPADLLEPAKARASALLHLQVWDFGISRTGSTDYQPTVFIRAYLVRRDGAQLVYSQGYSFGPDAGGVRLVNLGGTDIRFPSIGAAQANPARLLSGLRIGLDAVLRRIAADISG